MVEKNAKFDLVDILGNKVQSFDLDNSGVLDIITSDFTSVSYTHLRAHET